MRVALLGSSLALAVTLGGPALPQGAPHELEPVGEPYAVSPGFAGEDGDVAHDISGIACLVAAGAAPRRCMVVNDENQGAQLALIEGRKIVPGEVVELIGKKPSEKVRGSKPVVDSCPGGVGKFKEFDGEGVAYDSGFFYVVGSHGCSRRKERFRLSSFMLARIPVDATGAVTGAAETTYRLTAALRSTPALRDKFGRALKDDGLNVEGLAVIGERLFAGLRAPARKEPAYLVATSVRDLFAPGSETSPATAEVIPLSLGDGVGIRDLTPLPDGRLLILAGPAQDQAVPYSLFAAEPRAGGAVKQIGVLKALPEADAGGKAEAVAILAPDRVLVLFDGLPNGGPREYRVDLRPDRP